jgi:serine/threonine protein kinase
VIAQRRFSYDVATGSYVLGPVKAQHRTEIQQQEVRVDSYLEQQQAMHLSGTVKHLQEQSITSGTRTPSSSVTARGQRGSQVEAQDGTQQQLAPIGGSYTNSPDGSFSEIVGQLHAGLPVPQEELEEGVLKVGPEGPKPYYIAKLCDFGMSKVLSGQSAKQTITMGTITHQPPEVLEHGLLGPAADVYAYGILCKWLEEGRLGMPYRRPKVVNILPCPCCV